MCNEVCTQLGKQVVCRFIRNSNILFRFVSLLTSILYVCWLGHHIIGFSLIKSNEPTYVSIADSTHIWPHDCFLCVRKKFGIGRRQKKAFRARQETPRLCVRHE